MKVLLIGVFLNDFELNRINLLTRSQDKPSVAAIKYTKLISEGFENVLGGNLTNLFLAPMGMFPITKKFFWFKTVNQKSHYIPFINFFILKQFSISLYVFLFTLVWILKNRKHEDKLYIIFTSLYLPFLVGMIPIRFFGKTKIVSFVPDLPEFEFTYTSNITFPKNLFLNTYIKLSKQLFFLIDFYVFITEQMKLKFENKPFMVIEGFVDFNARSSMANEFEKYNAVMYSGALFEKFGLKILLEAFLDESLNFELWLFGDGDMVQEIKRMSEANPRIKYFGYQQNITVLEFQKKAKLLINPRPSNNEFTHFSFPSKLMEYMVSGTPVLTTKLPGIPLSYFDKLFFINNESADGFKNSILDCMSLSQEELDYLGFKAQSFVQNEKNNFSQIEILVNKLQNTF